MGRWSWSRCLTGPALLLSLLGCGCRTSVSGDNALLLYAAASTTRVVEEIRDQYSRQTGQAVELNFASSATLATQIRSGAEADLFLAADEGWVQALTSDPGLVVDRIDLLSNRLVVVLPKEGRGSLQSPRELLEASFASVAMANPDSMVPAGLYAREALIRLGLWEGPCGPGWFTGKTFGQRWPTWRPVAWGPESSIEPTPWPAHKSTWPWRSLQGCTGRFGIRCCCSAMAGGLPLPVIFSTTCRVPWQPLCSGSTASRSCPRPGAPSPHFSPGRWMHYERPFVFKPLLSLI